LNNNIFYGIKKLPSSTINKIKDKVDIIIVDFHAEATAEKIAFKNCCQIIKLNDKINILVFVKKNKLKI